MVAFAKIKKLTNWLFEGPVANTIPSLHALDKVMNLFIKIIYIIFRILFIITLGKKRRENSQFYNKLRYRLNISFSFYFFMFLYKVIGILRLGNPSLVKIYVPKYNYKVYCYLTEDDYNHMTIREDDIIENFQPKSEGIVVDIGAHYGRYTLIAAKRIGPKGKVIAIEADPKNFDMLNKNIKLNKLEHVITLNYAATSNKSKVKLSIPEKKSGHTIYSSIIPDRAPTEKFIEVNANTLDNLLDENGISIEEVNWIKIDVEGAELEVLKGATNVLSKNKDISLLIEIHNIENGKNLYRPIMDLLDNYNFKKEFEKIHSTGERHLIVSKQ